MAAFAKESLSPLLKSANIRRRSFDLCQKLGNHLLSPNASPIVPASSPSKSTNASPVENPCPSPLKLLSPLSPVFNYSFDNETCDASGATAPTSYHYKRRASDSLWIDTLPAENAFNGMNKDHKRRRSLTIQCSPPTVLLERKSTNNAQERLLDQAHYKKKQVERSETQGSVVTYNIIPPTPQKSMGKRPLRFQLDHDEYDGYLSRDGKDSGHEANENALKLDVNENEITQDRSTCESPKDMSTHKKVKRRSSAGAKYDLDESFVKALPLQWNLSLNPDDLLGKGSFGIVVGGSYHGEPVAVKVLKSTNVQQKASLLGEDNALNLPSHNHIVRIMDILYVGPDRTLIIMEKMERGNLLGLLNDSSFELDCSSIINISKQIALALVFCHRLGLLHLDVKPQNILVDRGGCCKLSDFGNSKKVVSVDSGQKYSKLEGTVPYTAPELFKGSKPTEKCDVYSFGITMWQIISREMPYENENEHTVIFRVVSQGLRPNTIRSCIDINGNNVLTEESRLISKITEVYERAWDAIPDLRPSMTDIHKKLIEIQFL